MAKTVCTRPNLFQKELQHLREALVKCKYPHWAINKVQSKHIKSNWDDIININNLEDNNSNPNASMDQANSSKGSTDTLQDTHNQSASTEEVSPQGKNPA